MYLAVALEDEDCLPWKMRTVCPGRWGLSALKDEDCLPWKMRTVCPIIYFMYLLFVYLSPAVFLSTYFCYVYVEIYYASLTVSLGWEFFVLFCVLFSLFFLMFVLIKNEKSIKRVFKKKRVFTLNLFWGCWAPTKTHTQHWIKNVSLHPINNNYRKSRVLSGFLLGLISHGFWLTLSIIPHQPGV